MFFTNQWTGPAVNVSSALPRADHGRGLDKWPEDNGRGTVHEQQKEGIMGLGRILVVDDEADVRKTVRLTLAKAGYDVVEAEDGEKAIAAIKSGDNPLMVDTVICDLHMPKVNGLEAIAFFRSQFPSVPVIVLTGKPDVQ
ncbi:MAG: response regulator, partial [Nitrospiraceae bacterium]